MTSTGARIAPHVPVLVSEVVAALALHGGETAVDGTFGAGGYTRAMLGAGAGRVIGFDRDPDAVAVGRSVVPDPRRAAAPSRTVVPAPPPPPRHPPANKKMYQTGRPAPPGGAASVWSTPSR